MPDTNSIDNPQYFYILTLGCKVNQYESQSVREAWLKAGHIETHDPVEANVAIINSCAITAGAMTDLRVAVRRLRRLSPACRVMITGCAAESLPDEVEAMQADYIIPNRHKAQFLNPDVYGVPSPFDSEENTRGQSKNFPAFSITDYDRSRAILKVHDGCSQCCTYCIVPASRGPSVSRPLDDTLNEALILAKAGFGEIVINGINLRQYKNDKEDFWDLLNSLGKNMTEEYSGKLRLRISSLEPGQLGERALEILKNSPLVAPHLHISLQSGSPSVLKRMGRAHYKPEKLPDFTENLAEIWPIYGLGADIITGFPGESEAEFHETVNLVKAIPLSYAHIFPYSKRPGTIAAKMPEQIPQEIKKERARILRDIIAEKKQSFLKKQLSLPEVTIVIEDSKPHGINEYYSDCILQEAKTGNIAKKLPVTPRGLAVTRPVRIENNNLIVEMIQE